MENDVGERSMKRLPKRRLEFIDGSISSYCSIINSPERIEHTRKASKLASILCGFESDQMREK